MSRGDRVYSIFISYKKIRVQQAKTYNNDDIIALIANNFPFEPTHSQHRLLKNFAHFILNFREKVAFVLKGYAGTGKTSMVSALVKSLPFLNIKTVLLAPTGRAAKVLAFYSHQAAHTIHRYIYYNAIDEYGNLKHALKQNKHRNTLFVVDEASMISLESSLLADLFTFIESGFQCRLLLLGDTAQLPPVGYSESPALDIDFLKRNFSAEFYEFCLIEVLRQEEGSTILNNATALREKIEDFNEFDVLPLFSLEEDGNLRVLCRDEIGEKIEREYSKYGKEEVVIITRSNKVANLINKDIRNSILYFENEIQAGELLMVVKNNYFWVKDTKVDFLANGDIIRIQRIKNTEERYGFRFANLEVCLLDYPDEPTYEVKVILESLHTNSANLGQEEKRRLWEEVAKDYEHIRRKGERVKMIKGDPFLNALEVKYSYALTCHKTQGGQWKSVFIEQGFFTEDMLNIEYLRWLYTALTRGVENVYLLNFDSTFVK